MDAQRSELIENVSRAIHMVNVRIQETPDYGIYHNIRAQLQTIAGHVSSGVQPTEAMKSRITVGVYAMREFMETDPDFADILFKVTHGYETL